MTTFRKLRFYRAPPNRRALADPASCISAMSGEKEGHRKKGEGEEEKVGERST